ncbi:MAG: hypothetical protein HGA45_11855 [Chloroflexales bacterium]|nr:hypothetical protein [Chloroflexales bacterium]
MKRISLALEACQPGEADFLFEQEAVSLVLIAFVDQMRRRDHLGEGVDALKTFSDLPSAAL